MAWEKVFRRRATIPVIGASAVWIAIVFAGARLTNFDEPYLPFAIAGIALFFLRAKLSRWEIYGWLLISALLVKVIHLPQVPFWVLRVAASMALLGFGAAMVLGLRAIWSESEDRNNALALLAPALILCVFIFGCARVLSITSGVNPQTDDAWLYAFDGSLGFQPSFFLGRILYDSLLLVRTSMLTYLALPFAMAVVCAWQIPAGARRICWHMLTILLLAGVGGWLLYTIVPGTGPIYAFGRAFPWKALPYKDLHRLRLEKMIVPRTIPRNAMPSLHVAWAVLLYWNSRKFPVALRSAILFFLIFTIFATLGSGQHYLVDLVGSLPFAVAVQATVSLVLRDLSRAKRSHLITTAIGGLSLTLIWLAIVRFGVDLALKSPVIPWTLMLATVGIAFWLHHWIREPDASSPESWSRTRAIEAESAELTLR
jgi:PAP2 superfamily